MSDLAKETEAEMPNFINERKVSDLAKETEAEVPGGPLADDGRALAGQVRVALDVESPQDEEGLTGDGRAEAKAAILAQGGAHHVRDAAVLADEGRREVGREGVLNRVGVVATRDGHRLQIRNNAGVKQCEHFR